MGVYESRAFEILGQPYGKYTVTADGDTMTLHKLPGCLVYLFFEKGRNTVWGIAVQSWESGVEFLLPSGRRAASVKFTLGKNTYADMEGLLLQDRFISLRYRKRELLPQLFSFARNWPLSGGSYFGNYTEYIDVASNFTIILSDDGDNSVLVFDDEEWRIWTEAWGEGEGDGEDFDELYKLDDDVDDDGFSKLDKERHKLDKERAKRVLELHPRSDDKISWNYYTSQSAKKIYLEIKKIKEEELLRVYGEDDGELRFSGWEYGIGWMRFGNVCVVDRLKDDEMAKYKKFREISRPTIIGIFYNGELATRVFAPGRGIVPHSYHLPSSFLP
jgi:hypothetical protein